MSENVNNKQRDEVKIEYSKTPPEEIVVDWWNKIVYQIKQFFRNIRRVIKWFPVIWKDRDWDYGYLLKILEFKLQQMYNDSSKWHPIENDTRQRHLKQALHDINILLNDELGDVVCKKQWDEFREKYGDLVTWITKDEKTSYYIHHSSWSKCVSDELAEEAEKQYFKIIQAVDNKHRLINARFWNNLKNNYMDWWD